MSKKSITLITAFGLVLALSLYYFAARSPQESSNVNTNYPSPSTLLETSQVAQPSDMLATNYLVYNPTTFDTYSNSGRLLFFYANWCPTCQPVNAELISSSEQLPKDLVVIRVNYNDNETTKEAKALAQKYAVTYQHTFVQIDSEGNELAKWNGGGINTILEKIK